MTKKQQSKRDLITSFESRLQKEIGENLLLSLSSFKQIPIRGISTGSCEINNILSGNPFVGLAFGRIVEIYGPEQSGKTTLALHCIREAQRLSLPTLFVDAEHALDVAYAAAIGVDLNNMSLSQPDYGEQALEIVKAAVRSDYKLIVVDSVPALVPKAELEGEIGDAHMGKQARLMGQAMRVLVGAVQKHDTILIFLNQIRMKLGVVFGNPEETPGGKALKFFSSYRIEIRSPRSGAKESKTLDGGKVEDGILSKIKVVKNKVFPPYRKTSVYIKYGKGFDRAKDIVSYMKTMGMFEGSRPRICGKAVTASTLEKMLATSANARKDTLVLLRESVKEERKRKAN